MGKLTGCLPVHPRKCLGPQSQHLVLVLGGPHKTDSCPPANFWAEEGPSRSVSKNAYAHGQGKPQTDRERNPKPNRGSFISGAEAEAEATIKQMVKV